MSDTKVQFKLVGPTRVYFTSEPKPVGGYRPRPLITIPRQDLPPRVENVLCRCCGGQGSIVEPANAPPGWRRYDWRTTERVSKAGALPAFLLTQFTAWLCAACDNAATPAPRGTREPTEPEKPEPDDEETP